MTSGSSFGLMERLGYQFKDAALLEKALTHRSFANELTKPENNEVLELLGDAVLGLSVADQLIALSPTSAEGQLSKKRSSLVNSDTLAEVARTLRLEDHLKLGKGEQASGGKDKPRLLASGLEALIGAVFVDGGYQAAHSVIKRILGNHINLVATSDDGGMDKDYKTRLQEALQQRKYAPPKYEVINEQGPDHEKVFKVSLSINGNEMSQGAGRTKKAAEQEAARAALQRLGDLK